MHKHSLLKNGIWMFDLYLHKVRSNILYVINTSTSSQVPLWLYKLRPNWI